MATKWSILCAGVTERMPKSGHNIHKLTKQLDGYDDIEFIMLIDNLGRPIDEKRNMLMSMANGEYVNFIDDDDEVASDYVKTIYPLLGGTDYIGFKVAHFDRGVRTKPVRHSLEYSGWSEDANGFYRNISHLNPIRREPVKDIPFTGLMGEDEDWAGKVYRSDKIKTQHFIDREMYFYYADINESVAYKQKEKNK